MRRSSSTRSCSISVCQSWKLAATRISPSSSRFSFETLSITSPLITVVLFQTGASRVEETTYLGKLFERATSGWPPRGQELVAPPAQQKGLGAPRLVERNFGCLVATLSADKTDPAAAAEALDARRVLDDSVERDVLTDNNPCRCASPCRLFARQIDVYKKIRTSTRPPIGSQLDSLAGKAIREP